MVMELKNIAILGPGGNVGSAIISELLQDAPRFNITAITRQNSSYTPPSTSNIAHTTVDYESFEALRTAFTGQDAVVNCITGGATQYEPSKRIIDAAVAAGVKFFFANEFVGDVMSEQYRRLPEAVVGAKVRIRGYLQELAGRGDMSWTSLNGGPFFDMWLAKGPAGISIPTHHARIYGTGTHPLHWTPLPAIGRAAANMLRSPDAVANRPIYICPIPRLTQRGIVSALEKILDTQFSREDVDVRKINEHARIALERGEHAKAIKGLAVSNQFYEGDSGNDFSGLVENEAVGVREISVDEAVRDVLERYGRECQVAEALFRVEACEV